MLEVLPTEQHCCCRGSVAPLREGGCNCETRAASWLASWQWSKQTGSGKEPAGSGEGEGREEGEREEGERRGRGREDGGREEG